uniref:Secreted protein n=1 Tax=Arundo donax TaxID=35708 RepID=A0A0A9G531_ARUDO
MVVVMLLLLMLVVQSQVRRAAAAVHCHRQLPGKIHSCSPSSELLFHCKSAMARTHKQLKQATRILFTRLK